MKITSLEVIKVQVNHRGDWLFVQLRTDDGLLGLGEASHGGFGPNRDAIVTAILRHQCAPLLVDQNPGAVTRLTASLWPVGDGLAGATAVSACEQALWDLAGQAAGLPICRLFGGPTRERIPLYANINRATTDRTPVGFSASAAAAVAEGYRAVKSAPFDGMDWRRVRDRDQRERIAHGLACVQAIREAVGQDIEVYVDCHSHFDVPAALEVAARLRDMGVLWFEEPVPTNDLSALQQVRDRLLDQQLIGGEVLFGIEGFWPYLAVGVWDAIMPDVKHCGGIAATVDISRLATARGVQVAPHNPSGPVATAASAQIAAALPVCRALEIAWGEVSWRGDLLSPSEQIEDGELVIPTGPGLGMTLDVDVLREHRVEP
ncbi:MAG: mandelate racemase/muconate lactonizing enzyme family protein [Thermomicrobiales bacterium]